MPEQPDTQLDIWGAETPVEQIPHACTRDETCQAPVDQHEPDCPVEQRLQREFGY